MFEKRRNGKRRTAPDGMTLLEVILAIAVTGFLLASAASFVVSVSSIWLQREDRHFFEDHVDGVTEFLRASFARAGAAVAAAPTGTEDGDRSEPPDGDESGGTPEPGESGREEDAGGSLLRRDEAPLAFLRPPGFAQYREPLLHFRLAEKPPLLVAPDTAPAQFIDGYLHFEAEAGLSLLWTSNLQEETEDLRDLRRTLLSPWVTAIRYVYWDERFETWEEEEEARDGEDGQPLLPRFLKITFTYEEESKERLLALPVPSTALPLF